MTPSFLLPPLPQGSKGFAVASRECFIHIENLYDVEPIAIQYISFEVLD